MNRSDFQRLAVLRLEEARALFAAGLFAGAYYLAGYSVECALKACIAKTVRAGDWPDLPLVQRMWSHDLSVLLDVSGLESDLRIDAAASRALGQNWSLVRGWREKARYSDGTTERGARDMIAAIEDPAAGVLPWVQKKW